MLCCHNIIYRELEAPPARFVARTRRRGAEGVKNQGKL